MDASKLKNVLADLNNDFNKSITESLNTLINSISANQTAQITLSLESLKTDLDKSIVNIYSPSNLEIVGSIGAYDLFGKFALSKIESILNENPYNISKIIADLQAYAQRRSEFIQLVKNANENLEKLNIEAHYYNDDTFEVGLLMPTQLTANKIVNVSKELVQWDKVFKTLKELTGESPEDTKIDFISNGSLQFFIENSPSIAMLLAMAIERIVKLYKTLTEIRIARDQLKNLGVNTSEQKAIEKQEKEIFNKEIDKISTDLVKEFAIKKIEQGRLNELRIAVKGHVTYIAKCVDRGMIIEITPPEVEEPKNVTESEDNKSEVKKIKEDHEKLLKQVEIVQKSTEIVKNIGHIGIDIAKFITDGDTSNESTAA